MTSRGWPGKPAQTSASVHRLHGRGTVPSCQISASVHRLHGKGHSPFMPEGRSTDASAVDQLQRVSSPVKSPTGPNSHAGNCPLVYVQAAGMDLCDT